MSADIQQVPAVDHAQALGFAIEIGEEIGFCLEAIHLLNDEVIYKEDTRLFHAIYLATYHMGMLVSDLQRVANGEKTLHFTRFENMTVKQ